MLQFLLRHKKAAILIGLILIAALVYYFWNKKTTSQRAIGNLEVDRNQLTITDDQATLISENLLGAMNRYGTDEKTIIDSLKTLRYNDLILVMKKFGTKLYNNAGLAENTIDKYFFSSNLNLIGWLQAELDGEDLDQVAAIFNNNGIPF